MRIINPEYTSYESTYCCQEDDGPFNPPAMYIDVEDEPLADWERELLGGDAEEAAAIATLRQKLSEPLPHQIGEGDVMFTLTNGKTLIFNDVRVDSVTELGEVGNVIGVEFFNSDRVVHVPFVSYWEFSYRY